MRVLTTEITEPKTSKADTQEDDYTAYAPEETPEGRKMLSELEKSFFRKGKQVGKRIGAQVVRDYQYSVLQLIVTGVAIFVMALGVFIKPEMFDFAAVFTFFAPAACKYFCLDEEHGTARIIVYIGLGLSFAVLLLGTRTALPEVWLKILGGACVLLSGGELYIQNAIREKYKIADNEIKSLNN